MDNEINIEEHKKWLRGAMLKERIYPKMKEASKLLKKNMSSDSFDFFASSMNYPYVGAGITISMDEPFSLKELYGKSYESIIESFLLSANARNYLKVEQSLNEKVKALAMSIKPTFIEAEFSKVPEMKIDLSGISQPLGPRAPLKKIKEEENPKIPKKVYSLYEENIKSIIAMEELYSRGYDSYYLTKILSAGILGENKKLVPTRWAITATDNALAEFNKKIILDFASINEFEIYQSKFLHNNFVILLIPGNFEYENYEAWAPKTSWGAGNSYAITEEYENSRKRNDYATKQVGAYYSVKNMVTEYLRKRKKQAKIIVFREISEGYNVPVGVWQVRENIRHAFENQMGKFNTIEEALKRVSELLTISISSYAKKSKILGQKRINDY